MNIESNIAAFNSTLAQYMALSSKTSDEVLEKKGRDLGIKLYQGFWAVKFGGAGGKRPGLARAELATRTQQRIGTILRPSVLREYLAQRSALRRENRALKLGALSYAGALSKREKRAQDKTLAANARERINLWQDFVGKEVAIRQRGIGALAASFLWYRRRTSQAKGTYFVRNRTGRQLGYVEKGDGFLRIVGETDGLAKVDARYGIVSRALVEAERDMIEYINLKQSQLSRQLFGSAA